MIQLTELIKAQLYESFMMFVSGAAFMILYGFFNFVKRVAKLGHFSASIWELLFWIAAGFLTSAFLYKCAFGEISFHVVVAFITGALLWKKLFYGILNAKHYSPN